MDPRTGIYRVRKSWFGKSILQELINYPKFIGGRVDASIREYIWEDVDFKYAPEPSDLIFKNKKNQPHDTIKQGE